jgi:transcription initiation factor TFIID subunit 1
MISGPQDLSGKDGDIVLFEYIEEYPPLMSFVGMCSKVKVSESVIL